MVTSDSTMANSPMMTRGPIPASGCTRAVRAIWADGWTGIGHQGVSTRESTRHARVRAPPPLICALEQSRCALAAADAHGHYAIARLAALHLVRDGSDHSRPGH